MSGEGPTNNKAYEDRVQRLFSRVNNIQSATAEEKQGKLREVERALEELESKLERQKTEKASKLHGFATAVQSLTVALDEEREKNERVESDFNQQLLALEKAFGKSIEEARALRDESDQRLVGKLHSEVEGLQYELARHFQTTHFEGKEELEQLVETDIPRIQAEIAAESAIRRELEAKIVEQFMEQVQELRDIFEEERKQREAKEEELVTAVNAVAREVDDGVRKQKDERERNEENILELVEKVIERLKADLTEY